MPQCPVPRDLIATASIDIAADPAAVWEALVTPERIARYMFGAEVVTDWKPGSTIVWRGEWNGRAFEDHGSVLRFEPLLAVAYSHFSPLSGKPDVPENYHNVTVELDPGSSGTRVTLTQDNNASTSERDHSQTNWQDMLMRLKAVVEAAAHQV